MAKKLAKTFAYLGIFFGYDENMRPIHLTLEYFPNSTPNEYITEILRTAPLGKKVTVKLTREGQWASKNFGYLAELPEDVKPFFKNKIHNIPHITMEIRNGGAPVDTWKAFTGEDSSRPCCKYWTGEITMFYRAGGHFSTSFG